MRLLQLSGVLVSTLINCISLSGADWPSVRSDGQQTGWQKDEKVLSSRNASRIQLLWQQRLDAPGGISDPVMLGPIITHRGVKELIFVKSAASVYAVDADLGRIFWTRPIETKMVNEPGRKCRGADTINPVLHSIVDEAGEAPSADSEYSDGNKPLYIMAADGSLHALRPSSGNDLLPPFRIFPTSIRALAFWEREQTLEAWTRSCTGTDEHVWSKPVGASGLDLNTRPVFIPPPPKRPAASFDWKGKRVIIDMNEEGFAGLRIGQASGWPLFEVRRDRGVATWLNPAGERWLYAVASGSLTGILVSDHNGSPAAQTVWSVHGLPGSGPPVVANGVVYLLTRLSEPNARQPQLHAFDATDGRELYKSTEQIPGGTTTGLLALANGHVCFAAEEGSLVCFGIPFRM